MSKLYYYTSSHFPRHVVISCPDGSVDCSFSSGLENTCLLACPFLTIISAQVSHQAAEQSKIVFEMKLPRLHLCTAAQSFPVHSQQPLTDNSQYCRYEYLKQKHLMSKPKLKERKKTTSCLSPWWSTAVLIIS